MRKSNRLLGATSLLALVAAAPALAGERTLVQRDGLTAKIDDHKGWCAEAVPVMVDGPQAAFEGDRAALQKLLGGVRAIMGFECAKAKMLLVEGRAKGKVVLEGTMAAANGWVFATAPVKPAVPTVASVPPQRSEPSAPSSFPAYVASPPPHPAILEALVASPPPQASNTPASPASSAQFAPIPVGQPTAPTDGILPQQTAQAPVAAERSNGAQPAASTNAASQPGHEGQDQVTQSVARQPHPLIGDWTGSYKCGDAVTRAVISIEPLDRGQFKGLIEFQGADPGRISITGTHDAASGQVQITPKDWIKRPSSFNAVGIKGVADAGSRTMQLDFGCWGTERAAFVKSADAPETVERVAASLARQKRQTDEELARPRRGRLVGTLPAGEVRPPSCDEFVQWAESQPTGVRVELFPDGSGGLLRHFDDETSKTYFGSPAYHWLGRGKRSLEDSVRDVCGKRNDQGVKLARQVAGDGKSLRTLDRRRRLDEQLAAVMPMLAGRGDSARVAYQNLSQLDDPAKVKTVLTGLQIDPGTMIGDDYANLTEDAARYKAAMATEVIAEAETELRALPPDGGGLRHAVRIRGETAALLGPKAPADAMERFRATAGTRIAELSKAVTDAAAVRVGSLPRDLSGMAAAQKLEQETRDLLKAASEASLRDFESALAAFRVEARGEAVRAETQWVASAPMTLDAASAARARLAAVEKAVGDAAPPTLPELRRAVEAHAAAVATAILPEFQKDIAALPSGWASIETADDRVGAVEEIVGNALAAPFRQAADARVAALYADLRQGALLEVRSAVKDRPDGAEAVLAVAAQAAAMFEKDPRGKPEAVRLREEGAKLAGEALNRSFPQYKAELAKVEVSRASAVRLASASTDFKRRTDAAPAYAQYATHALEVAKTMWASSCEKALSDAKMSSSDGRRELAVGDGVIALGQFICDLREAGFHLSAFEKPGFSSSSKDFVLRYYAPDDLEWRAAMRVAEQVEQAMSALTGRRAEGPKSPGTVAGGREASMTPGRFVLREMEVSPGKQALVGVSMGDDAKSTQLSIKEWKELSAGLVAAGGKPDASRLCAAWRDRPDSLRREEEGFALLVCPPK